MKQLTVLSLWLFTLFLFLSPIGLACDCAGEMSVSQALKNSDAVFMGEVLSTETIDDVVVTSFKMETSFKGDITEFVDLTDHKWDTCRFPFEIGKRYFVYAKIPDDGVLDVNSCGRTKEITEENFEEELKQLNLGEFSEGAGEGVPSPIPPTYTESSTSQSSVEKSIFKKFWDWITDWF